MKVCKGGLAVCVSGLTGIYDVSDRFLFHVLTVIIVVAVVAVIAVITVITVY